MLTLSRRLGESILIGDDVRVTVVGFRGDKVQLGVEAPIEVLVDRPEVRERRAAGATATVPGREGGGS